VRVRKQTDDKNPDVNVIGVGGGESALPSKQYYNNTKVVANYTRTVAQMLQVIWTGKAIANESLFLDADPQYMEISKKVFELEKQIAFASPEPEVAQEITVSTCWLRFNSQIGGQLFEGHVIKLTFCVFSTTTTQLQWMS
jgi:predicted metalloendopeptidase